MQRVGDASFVLLLVMSGCAAVTARTAAGTSETAPKEAPPSTGIGATSVQAIGGMAHIPATTYRMGSETGEADERPVHEVRVAALDMDLAEVTVSQYLDCVRAEKCPPAVDIPRGGSSDVTEDSPTEDGSSPRSRERAASG
jgi:formylglycine-generating enzyme required for sulfatase activity